jgi:3-oxoacyl-[acyl-carrier protein] reductase
MGQVDGKIALVTGGASGIGEACVQTLAREGAAVVISDIDDVRGNDLASAVAAAGQPTIYLRHDVTDEARWQEIVAEIERRYGRLDILVNAAGFTQPVPHADLDALDDAFIDRMFQVNWRGPFAAVRTFAPLLKASGDGLVVSISSIAAFTGVGSNIAYCAAKAGIDVMTKALARALAPQVRVLAVSPGVVDTAFVPGRGADFNAQVAASTPLRRIGGVEDIAAAITACATHLGYSTGHIIQVDGGRAL